MKSIFKILCLGAALMIATTAVVDQGHAAEGSQLIFQSNMAHQNYISISNTGADAVTILTQYYNDEMKRVLWYLRVIPGGGNVLVDPFDHAIPGTGDEDDMNYVDVSGVISALPAMSTDDDAGINSGRFVIAVTAVGANTVKTDDDLANQDGTVNILFPTFLAKDLHGTDNIDNCGSIKTKQVDSKKDNNLEYTENGTDGKDDCEEEGDNKDETSKNVGDLNVGNAEPIAFNHLTGHFTEALVGTTAGGSDQTASWGGTPVVRAGVAGADEPARDYQTLDATTGGHLADDLAGGKAVIGKADLPTGTDKYTDDQDDVEIRSNQEYRRVTDGSLVLPALHGGGEETEQIMLFLSVADDFGGAGNYQLIPAMTKYKVVLQDSMGDKLDDPEATSGPVFGGVEDPEDPSGLGIIVNGIRVMIDAGDCGGDMISGAWTLADLTGLVPEASSGKKDFAGLDAMLDSVMNSSPGSINFMRTDMKCTKDYGDGDSATGSTVENNDGVPTTDKRTYTGGTLIVEEKDNVNRNFVTTGQALLKFVTPNSTFAASWPLSPEN